MTDSINARVKTLEEEVEKLNMLWLNFFIKNSGIIDRFVGDNVKAQEKPKFDITKPLRTIHGKKKTILVYDEFEQEDYPNHKFCVVIKDFYGEGRDGWQTVTSEGCSADDVILENIPKEELEQFYKDH